MLRTLYILGMNQRTLIAVAAAIFIVPTAQAQLSPVSSGHGTDAGEVAPPALEAQQRLSAIRIDGVLDEESWQSAPFATGFVQGEPVEGAPAEQRTEVRILFDDQALFVGVMMYDTDAGRIGDQLVRRDAGGQYDFFEIALDPNNDRRTGYLFRVSAAGVQRDVYLYDDTREDANWDAVWESAVRRLRDGWSAEFRIPLSQIRYDPSDSVQSWGVNFKRHRIASNEQTYFSLESRLRHGKVSVFGRLDGLRLPRGSRRIEARPYTLADRHTGPSDVGNPFFDGSSMGTRAGVDLRYGLGSAFTLDMAFNPDFGQVEVDPAVINLSAFETFFPEKRPFFVEDAQVLDFSLAGGRTNRLFYSRRIGRKPHGGAPLGVEFFDIPGQTKILGAAKLTGRTSSGTSIGALVSITEPAKGSSFTAGAGFDQFLVEPQSQFGVVRLQQDFRGGATQIGAIVTDMHRGLPADSSFDFLVSNAYSAGIDFEHNWGGSRSRNWALTGFFAGSAISGPTAAITRIQRSSIHYFQRPDATRFSVDSTRTSITGVNWRLQFERRSAEHWTGGVWAGEISPGFEINDLGFSRDGERLDVGARLNYREILPGKLFRSYNFSLWTFHNFRHEALDDVFSPASWAAAHQRGGFFLNTDFTFLNYWNAHFSTHYSPQSQSNTATRGGPLMLDPASTRYTIRLRTDRRASVFLQPSVTYDDRHRGGYKTDIGVEMTLRPSPSVQIQLQPKYSQEIEPAQYVTSTDDASFGATYGRRYIFAELERRSFSLQTRLNMAFTPHLTLQLFAQPLLSSGDYLSYKQLREARTFDFDVFNEGTAVPVVDGVSCTGGRTCVLDGNRYVDFDGDGASDLSFADRSFTIQSLRLNAVLRWEYRPGSTIFLVWQQSRSNECRGATPSPELCQIRNGSFDVTRDFSSLFGDATPDNMFIIKVNYWLGL